MKIDKIKLNNIQGHKATVLYLDPGVNVIKGRSHSGKSSIIRGIRWLFFNEPKGIDLRSWDGSDKEQIDFSIEFGLEGHEIKRFKKGIENGYYLDWEKLKAIRFAVPQEVKEAFPISPINFQPQSELYFLFNNSPGEVAEKLNEIAKISEVDKCYKAINSIIRETSHEVNSLKSRIERTEKEIKDLAWVDIAKKMFDEVDSNLEQVNKLESEISELEHSIDTINRSKQQIDELNTFLKVKPKVQILKKKIEKRKIIQNEYLGLQHLIVFINESEEIIKNLKVIDELKSRYEQIKDLRTESRSVASECVLLSDLIADTELKIKRKESADKTLRSAIRKRDQILEEHAEDFCAYCGAFRTHWREH
ncbi:MAG: AAA family ATPase [Halobacteriota archaeon]|nr:AAA family ATPase [Halobacteriota archaeon]